MATTQATTPSHTFQTAAASAGRASKSISPTSSAGKSKDGRAAASSRVALTGAAAMSEAKKRRLQGQNNHQQHPSRQSSPNPAIAAMQALMGQGGMSRPSDAPAANKLSEPLRQAAEKIVTVPENIPNVVSEEQEISPISMSFGLEGATPGGAMTATSNNNFVSEPGQMTEGESYGGSHNHNNNGNSLAVPDQDINKNVAFSYPGPPTQNDHGQQDAGPSRGMSLPGTGYGQNSPKSPASNKRHKCPYCSTDFTRHHNLKSHLLTHSQEKPYVCQTCQARFRRLHDLKRHTKLHTGERPHTCDKCGRRFARGDALARHNKGPGGCAGRRSSFGGDDEFGPDAPGEGMDGVEYDDGDDGADEHGRRISEPNRKRQHLETPQDTNREVYRQHSSTYPPAPTRGTRGAMGPPQVVHPGSNQASSPRDLSGGHPSPAGGSSIGSAYYGQGQVFAEPGMMTQSPKPLSPGHPPDQHRLSVGDGSAMGRNRSTSLTAQFQQQHFGRGSGGGRTPPQSNAQLAPNQGVAQGALQSAGSTSVPQARGGVQPIAMQGGQMSNMHGHPQQQQQQQQGNHGQLSNPGSLSSHGRSSGSSLRDMNQDPNDIWTYVRGLETRFNQMQDEYELRISRLQGDIINLKGQLGQMSNAGSYTSEMGRQGPY